MCITNFPNTSISSPSITNIINGCTETRLPVKFLTGDRYKVADYYNASIVTYEELRADLIVIGTHESSGLFRFLEGDISGSIIHETNIPVLVIPTDKTTE